MRIEMSLSEAQKTLEDHYDQRLGENAIVFIIPPYHPEAKREINPYVVSNLLSIIEKIKFNKLLREVKIPLIKQLRVIHPGLSLCSAKWAVESDYHIAQAYLDREGTLEGIPNPAA